MGRCALGDNMVMLFQRRDAVHWATGDICARQSFKSFHNRPPSEPGVKDLGKRWPGSLICRDWEDHQAGRQKWTRKSGTAAAPI